MKSIGILILAAGKGTRMKSTLPKVMHKIGGLPLLGHVIKTAQKCAHNHKLAVVIASDMNDIQTYGQTLDSSLSFFQQVEQKGTGHAVAMAKDFISATDIVLIMLGDVPFVQPSTLQNMLTPYDEEQKIDLVVLAMHELNANTYGRLVTDNDGRLQKIVEVKEASDSEKRISLCNAGFMAVRSKYLWEFLQAMQPSRVTGEYYLTDIVAYAYGHEWNIKVVEAPADEVKGVNSQHDLAAAEHDFQQRCRHQALDRGVILVDPQTVYFSHDTVIEGGTTIHPNVVMAPGVVIDGDVEIFSFSHMEGVHIKSHAKIGPYARIRPNTVIASKARVGNFVEIKNSTLGFTSKANHLAYVGDSTVGERCNIGAGTITVNYDGVNKWPTFIEDGAFVGSNSTLIAPITIGADALIAAGSTITKDVAKNTVAFGRTRQVELPGRAEQIRHKARQLKDKK